MLKPQKKALDYPIIYVITQSFSVPEAGIEPARYCYHWILSPARLPIPPPGLVEAAKILFFWKILTFM